MPTRLYLLAGLLALVVAGGCASTSGPLRPSSASAVHPIAQRVVAEAQALMGAAYRPGGAGPDGFDCSGLVQYLYARYGVQLPRTSARQFTAGEGVSTRRILPGDLVFFRINGRSVSHVGLWLGDGRFLHAPSVGRHVRVDDLDTPYWSRRFAGVRRVIR